MSFLAGLFGKTKKSRLFDFQDKLSFLGVDMNCHILPGVDDGSETVEQSYQLLRGLQQMGISHFICTPHISHSQQVDSAHIDAAYEKVKSYIRHRRIPVKVHTAAEYLLDSDVNQFLQKEVVRIIPGGYVLLEMDLKSEYTALFEQIAKIQEMGYTPILAHPERYTYYHQDYAMYERIKDAGCLLQMNLLSVSSYYGGGIKRVASYLMKKGMYDFVGSDVHYERHMLALQDVVGKYDVKNLLKRCTIKNESLKDHLRK